MSKKHFLLFDFALPIAGILFLGHFLAGRFDATLFHRIESLKAFGIGFRFAHSDLRATLWEYSWLVFALIPAAAWLVWVRINVEYDYILRGRKLDRPVYKFFRGLARWIDGHESKRTRLFLEGRLAQSHDQIRRLDAELSALRAQAREEWSDEVMPPARQG